MLRLPDLDFAKSAVLNTLWSSEWKRSYRFAIDDFVAWYCSEPRLAFNKTVVLRYRLEFSHPVIRAHPRTGRKVLFVNEGFTVFIDGMTATESSALLQELFMHTARQETIYAHQWREGDLLMWDNCLVQHRAVPNYELPLRRLMHRTTVAGP